MQPLLTNSEQKVSHAVAETFIELLDKLYELLPEASDAPELQARISQIICWVEERVPAALESSETHDAHDLHTMELEMGAASVPDFALLIQQAQQQCQQ
jgi:hypothetical protein